MKKKERTASRCWREAALVEKEKCSMRKGKLKNPREGHHMVRESRSAIDI
jgi:hypothetical protein